MGKVPETGKSSRDFDWTRDFRMNERLGALRRNHFPDGNKNNLYGSSRIHESVWLQQEEVCSNGKRLA